MLGLFAAAKAVAKAKAKAKAKGNAKAKAAANKPETIPMLANVLVCKALDKALAIGLGEGLHMLVRREAWRFLLRGTWRRMFRPANVLHLVSQGELQRCYVLAENGEELLVLDKKKPMQELHCIADCGAVGFAAELFLFSRGSCHGSFCSDVWAHDAHNSIKRALVNSQLWSPALEWALVANFTMGPFSSDAFLLSFQESAKDMIEYVSKDIECPLWCAFYEDIARSLGPWDEDKAWTNEHMLSVVLSLKEAPPLHTQGDHVKLSRWFSLWDRWEERLHTWGSFMLMTLTWIGLHKGFFNSDLLCFIMKENSLVSATTGPMLVALEVPRSVKELGNMIKMLRNTCRGTEHGVALILGNAWANT